MRLRVASEADVPVLSGLIERSVRELQRGDYTPLQIELALRTVYGVDTTLIRDGTYFVVEHGDDIVGCGGWSRRKTLYGGDIWSGREDELLDPRVDAAKIRAFFVRPDFARRGIGTQLLNECEYAAQKAGFRKFEMGATITGIPLYEAHGYTRSGHVDVPLPGGEKLPVVHMVKTILPI